MLATQNEEYKKFMSSPPTSATGVPNNSSSSKSSADEKSSHSQPHIALIKPPKVKVEWSTGLCDCFSDIPNCCVTCWCPCITFGRISEIIDKGSSSCGVNGALYTLIACIVGCPFFYTCFYRTKMRQQYGLKESPCWDCLLHTCCESCALCQEYRELQIRGFDMKIGWHGNLEKRNREMAMSTLGAPPIQGMSR
ncbi:hypothetical protein QQ045_016063 [Rhodiola kirilowii]